MKKFLCQLIAAVVLLEACGPLPPIDPHNLKNAKDDLSRGHYWYNLICYDEALNFFNESLNYARLSDNVPLIVRSLNSMGASLLAQDRLPEAADKLEQALEISLSLPNEQPDLDKVLGNLGSLAYKSKRPADAFSFWQNAVAAALKRGENPAQYYCNLARLYWEEGRNVEFQLNAAEAEKWANNQTKPSDVATLAEADYLLGQAAQLVGKFAEAKQYFQTALELNRQVEDLDGLAQTTEALGLLLVAQQEPQEAAGHLDRAFYLWASLGATASCDRVWHALSELHQKAGFPKSLAPYAKARQNIQNYLIFNKCP